MITESEFSELLNPVEDIYGDLAKMIGDLDEDLHVIVKRDNLALKQQYDNMPPGLRKDFIPGAFIEVIYRDKSLAIFVPEQNDIKDDHLDFVLECVVNFMEQVDNQNE